MVELIYDEKHLISLVVPDRQTDRQTNKQTNRQTVLGVELTSPFGRGQLKNISDECKVSFSAIFFRRKYYSIILEPTEESGDGGVEDLQVSVFRMFGQEDLNAFF